MDLAWDLPNSGQLLSRHHGPKSFFPVPDLLRRASMFYLLRTPTISDDLSVVQALRSMWSRFRDFLLSAARLLPPFHWRIAILRSKNLIWINIHAITGIGPD